MRKHALLTMAGILFGVLALAWVRPETPGGSTFLVVAAVAVANAIGALVPTRAKPAIATQPNSEAPPTSPNPTSGVE